MPCHALMCRSQADMHKLLAGLLDQANNKASDMLPTMLPNLPMSAAAATNAAATSVAHNGAAAQPLQLTSITSLQFSGGDPGGTPFASFAQPLKTQSAPGIPSLPAVGNGSGLTLGGSGNLPSSNGGITLLSGSYSGAFGLGLSQAHSGSLGGHPIKTTPFMRFSSAPLTLPQQNGKLDQPAGQANQVQIIQPHQLQALLVNNPQFLNQQPVKMMSLMSGSLGNNIPATTQSAALVTAKQQLSRTSSAIGAAVNENTGGKRGRSSAAASGTGIATSVGNGNQAQGRTWRGKYSEINRMEEEVSASMLPSLFVSGMLNPNPSPMISGQREAESDLTTSRGRETVAA